MTIEQPADPAERERINQIFRRLRALDASFDPKIGKDDRVDILIAACISEGLNAGPRITGTLAKLGYNRRYAGMRLNQGSGNNPALHTWRRDADGAYRIIPGSTFDLAA